MVLNRAVLFALLCLSLAMGESVLVWFGNPRPFAAVQQSGKSSFLNAKAGDEGEVGGVKLRSCLPGRFVMGSSPDLLWNINNLVLMFFGFAGCPVKQ
jgi:hypothetical protein